MYSNRKQKRQAAFFFVHLIAINSYVETYDYTDFNSQYPKGKARDSFNGETLVSDFSFDCYDEIGAPMRYVKDTFRSSPLNDLSSL